VELLRDPDRPHAWMLLVDGVPQSYVDLDDPRHLELEYVRRLGHLIDLAAPAGMPLRVLHLGAGGLTLARYVAATRPGSRQLAVESDPKVAALVRRRLPHPELDRPVEPGEPGESRPRDRATGAARPGGRIELRIGDARAVLDDLAARSADVIIADVFTGARTPAHLTTEEFTAAAGRVLAPAGTYAVNVSDGPPLAHARRRVAAVLSVFGRACVLAEAAVLHDGGFGNLVVAGSRAGLPVAELARRAAADPSPAQVLDSAAAARFAAEGGPGPDGPAVPPPGVFA
jgi:spermidine synthase